MNVILDDLEDTWISEGDVEDLFDAVHALEQQKYTDGQAEGLEEGHNNHYQQGFTLGWQQACHLLHELGTIEGKTSNCKLMQSSCLVFMMFILILQLFNCYLSVTQW